MDGENADTLANMIVLNTILGQDTDELKAKLASVKPEHQFLEDLKAKREAFEQAKTKYTPKFDP